MKLTWNKTTAYCNGLKVFEVVKENTGWKLYRFVTRNSGETVFKSKEGVPGKRDGISYANGLATLWK